MIWLDSVLYISNQLCLRYIAWREQGQEWYSVADYGSKQSAGWAKIADYRLVLSCWLLNGRIVCYVILIKQWILLTTYINRITALNNTITALLPPKQIPDFVPSTCIDLQKIGNKVNGIFPVFNNGTKTVDMTFCDFSASNGKIF